jgi:hypothetical protein
MALARHDFTVVDDHGNIVTDAQVEVRREIAGAPLAVLYSDRDGTVPLGNPFNVDPTTAVAAFHVVGGAYRVRAYSGSFERVARYVAVGTAAETDAGLIPTSISTGWEFDDATADADPGSGLFRLNHATPASATAVYLDNENAGGNSVTAWLDSLDDSGDSGNRGQLHLCDPDQPTEVFRVYTVTGSVVDGTGYRKLTVTHISGAGSFTAGTLYSITFSARGTTGVQAASDVSFSPTGGIASTDVQAAIAELDGEKQPLDSDLTSIAALSTTAAGRSALTIADPGADRILAWDDSADTVAPIALADITAEGAPASGDYFLMYGAEGDLRKVDFDDMPGGGLILLASGTVSAAATLDIVLTGYTGYRALKLVLSSFLPVTDDVELWLRVSTNGGSSYDATGYSYVLITDHDSDGDAIDPIVMTPTPKSSLPDTTSRI